MQLLFDEAEMRSQDVCDVRVSCGQIDHDAEQFRQGRARAAVLPGEPQPSDARVTQPPDLSVRQDSALLALLRPVAILSKSSVSTCDPGISAEDSWTVLVTKPDEVWEVTTHHVRSGRAPSGWFGPT